MSSRLLECLGLGRIHWRDCGLLARHHIRYSLRSGAAIGFLLLTLSTGLIIAHLFFSGVTAIENRLEADAEPVPERRVLVDEVVSTMGEPAARWALGKDERFVQHLLWNHPGLLSIIFLLLLFSLPLLIPIASFNQFSGDIQSRSLRYLLTRTDRSSLYMGRFLATVGLSWVTTTILVAVVMLYALLEFRVYGLAEMFWIGLWSAVGLALLAPPFIALCSWISAACEVPFISMLVSNLVIGGVPVIAAMASAYHPSGGLLGWLLPWELKFSVLHPDPSHKVMGLMGLLLYTSLFLFLGLRTFRRRDL